MMNRIMARTVTLLSARNLFGAVQTAHIIIKDLLLPIRRISWQERDQVDRCAVENVALLDYDGAPLYKTDLSAPNSLDVLERLNSSCYWLPVYDVTRLCFGGLLIDKNASEQYERLGFTELQITFSV